MDTIRYTPQKLIDTVRWAKSHPTGTIQIRYGDYMTGREYMAWFMKCLDAKINRNDARRWRKLTDEYQNDQAVDAFRIARVLFGRIRYPGRNILSTPELQRRYPNINNPE